MSAASVEDELPDFTTQSGPNGELLWRLSGAGGLYARELWPDSPGSEVMAEEMLVGMPEQHAEWGRAAIREGDKELPTSAASYVRWRVAKDAQHAIARAVSAGRIEVFNPLKQPTRNTAKAFVRRDDVVALLGRAKVPPSRQVSSVDPSTQSSPISAKAAKPQQPTMPTTSAATDARWGANYEAFKREAVAKAVARHESEPFASLTAASRWLSEESPKEDGGTDCYTPDTCKEWLKAAGYDAAYFR